MDWLSLSKSMKLRDDDYPARTAANLALTAVLDGTQYDHIENDMGDEKIANGDYIPLAQRRPSVRSNLCSVVVEDSVSLLFGDAHFPAVVCDDEATSYAIHDLVKSTTINTVMTDAATRGSVGSVAIFFQVLSFKPNFRVMPTAFLTPEWNLADPSLLDKVTEKFKVKAAQLIEMGYASVKTDDGDHWFQREWTSDREIWYLPRPVKHFGTSVLTVDYARSTTHGLGFVPIIWVKNLPGGDDIDGACTFKRGIDNVIELDYLMSQGGRGLKYASDPTLVLKSENDPGRPVHVGGAASALIVPPDGDAKLLEINGQSSNAVLEHCRELRSTALELMHGNRAHGDRMTAAQSGRAMEMMNRGLIGLASHLRNSYGEGALLALVRMVCDASKRVSGGLIIAGRRVADMNPDGLLLRWPAWYPPTHEDREAEAGALSAAMAAGIVSRKTAIASIGPTYDVEDLAAERVEIDADRAEELARQLAVKAAVQVKENAPA